MERLLKTRAKKRGQPPVSLVPVADQKPKPARITVIDYDVSNLTEKTLEDSSKKHQRSAS